MRSLVRVREESEAGVVLIIVACAMVVLIGMLAIAIDASYGFVQNRRAQNGSDFAAFAVAQQLYRTAACTGTSAPPTMNEVDDIINNLVDSNEGGHNNNWSGEFLNSDGTVITLDGTSNTPAWRFTPSSSPDSVPPAGACGVEISATPTWKPFFAGIFGVHQLGGFATGSVKPLTTTGPSVSIVALNKSGPHEILGGGTGQFLVSGDIVLNTDVLNQPWSGTYTDSSGVTWEWDDAIDAKTNSNLYVYGTIHSSDAEPAGNPLWPLDTCFHPDVLGEGNPSTPSTPYQTGDPASGLPTNQMFCSEYGGAVNIDYDNIDPTYAQIDDPLTTINAPPSPLDDNTNISCPGSAGTQVFGAISPTTSSLSPGDYQQPVELTGSVTFQPCPNGYPGIYRFDQGLWINPGPGDTVTGNNVVIATKAPYPVAGNVPGSVSGGTFTASGPGNGAPCLPAGTMTSGPSGHGTPEAETSSSTPCGGTNPTTYGVVAYGDSTYVPDPAMTGANNNFGNNFSAIIGGQPGSSVTLTGPTTGAYAGTNGKPGMVLYQDPATEANYGFDAESGDAAQIQISGVVYNASLAAYGANAPLDYWDGVGGGIPFYAGGTLQAGFGAGWATDQGPAQSARIGHARRHGHRGRLQHRRRHRHHHSGRALHHSRQLEPVAHRMMAPFPTCLRPEVP